MEPLCVKSEPEWEGEDAYSLSEAGWLIDHEVKDEQDWESEAGACGVSEAAARAGLYNDHQVKDELVLGPELLQPPDVVFTLRASLNQVKKEAHAQAAVLGRTCLVSLERMFINTVDHTCRVGYQTYKLRLCPQRPMSVVQDVNETNAMKSTSRSQQTNKSQLCVRSGLKKGNTETAAEQEASVSSQGYSEMDAAGEMLVVKHLTANKTNVTSNDKCNSHFTCDSCSLTFETILKLLEHKQARHSHKRNPLGRKKKHTGEKPYKCGHCSYASTYKTSLLVHERIHTGEKPYKCASCSFACAHRHHLLAHESKHTGEKPYKCGHCSYASTYKQCLLVHERIHTGEKPYKCTQCSYASTKSGNLLAHERIHTGEKPYKCASCSFACSRKHHLLTHERKHSGEKPYKCGHCSYAGVQKSELLVHERIHTGEKPYKCTQCSYASTRSSNLLTHERKHAGEKSYKSYKCGHCSYACFQKSHLIIHEKIHTGEKPFKCGYCSYASGAKDNLLAHESSHTNEKPHKSNICCETFDNSRGLKEHTTKLDHALAPLRPRSTDAGSAQRARTRRKPLADHTYARPEPAPDRGRASYKRLYI